MNRDLCSWTTAPLGNLATVVRGITFPATAKEATSTSSNVCCLRTSNIQKEVEWDSAYFVPANYVKREDQFVRSGDVLMSMANSYELVGKVAIAHTVPHPTAFGAFLAAIRPTTSIDGRYLFHLLRTNRVQSELRQGSTQTTNIANISVARLSDIEVPIAPLPEQKRIADKLDAVLARVDACRERLGSVTSIITRFKQSVLSAATSGRLTEDWRDANGPLGAIGSSDQWRETFAVLEAKLSVELRGKRREEVLGFFSLIRESAAVPPGWVICPVGVVGMVSNGSTPSRADPSLWGAGISWVSSGEVRNNLIYQTKEQITDAGFSSCSVKLLPAGTVLIAMIGEGKTRGQSAVLRIPATINQNIAAIVPFDALLHAEYLWRSFEAKYEDNRREGNGTGPQALNCQRVRELRLNLPPLAEQYEITRRVDKLFAFADRLEERLRNTLLAADRLTPALLAKAFRGELVPQDPNDEPAAELLKRLAEKRSDAGAAVTGSRGKRTRRAMLSEKESPVVEPS